MPVLRTSFLARRMGSAWLLLCCLTVSVLITTALISALVNFYSGALPSAIRQEFASSGALSVVVSGNTDAADAASQTDEAAAWLRGALRTIPYRLYHDVWSDNFNLPLPTVSGSVPVLQAAAMENIKAFAVLKAGTWPASPRPGQPIPVALPAGTAQPLHVRIGSVLSIADRTTGSVVKFRVTGLYARKQSSSPYWNADPVGSSGGGFAVYGPALVSPAAFRGTASSDPLAPGSVSFVALLDGAAIGPGNMASLATQFGSAVNSIENSQSLSAMAVNSPLPAQLAIASRQLATARMLVIISALQLLILAAAALALAGRLLASHRDDECALLAARGAARWQLVKPSLAEAVLACAVAAVIGALAGGGLAGLLQARVVRHAFVSAGSSLAAWLAVALVFVLCLLIVIWPALRPAGISAVRVRRGRQALVATATAVGADVALIVLAVLSVRELRGYSAASAASGTGIDPVIVIAPAVALAGLAVVALRLLPIAVRGLERLTERGRRLGTAMANWEISRRPVRQSGPVLLVILAVGAGTLALAQYASWRQAAADQADFAVGADVRVNLVQAPTPPAAGRIGRLRGVTDAMAVSQAGVGGGSGTLMAVTARQAAATVLLRPDLSATPAAQLWREITPSAEAGLAIPGRPALLAITATVTPGAGGRALGPMPALVTVQDASGAAYQLSAGSIPADGKPHELVAQIAPAGGARYPLRFLGLSLSYNWPSRGQPGGPTAVRITGLAESAAPSGPIGRPFAAGSALAGFRVTVSAPDMAYLNTVPGGDTGVVAPQEVSWSRSGSAQQLVLEPGNGPHLSPVIASDYGVHDLTGLVTMQAPDPLRVVPVIATRSFLTANDLHVGSGTSVQIGNVIIGLRIVGAVSAFPTTSAGGALIADEAAIQDALASQAGSPLPVTSWWLRTVGATEPAGLAAGMPAGTTVTTVAGQATALRSEPLAAAPVRGALAVSLAAALLAAFGFCVNVAASARARRSQRALLAALGVPPTAQARLFCLEEAMLSVPAAVVGLVIGVLLAHLLIPALTVSASGGQPVPPVLVVVPVGWVLALAFVVPVIPVLAAAISAVRQPDPAAELRVAEAA